MNKRKPDDEFALINLSYFRPDGSEVVVHCPETKGISATLEPARRTLSGKAARPRPEDAPGPQPASEKTARTSEAAQDFEAEVPEDRHYTIAYGDVGHTYDTIIGPYLAKAKKVTIEDPYIRAPHQIANFVRFCETVVKSPTVREIHLLTGYDEKTDLAGVESKIEELKQTLLERDVVLSVEIDGKIHDREIRIYDRWIIKIGRWRDFNTDPYTHLKLPTRGEGEGRGGWGGAACGGPGSAGAGDECAADGLQGAAGCRGRGFAVELPRQPGGEQDRGRAGRGLHDHHQVPRGDAL